MEVPLERQKNTASTEALARLIQRKLELRKMIARYHLPSKS